MPALVHDDEQADSDDGRDDGHRHTSIAAQSAVLLGAVRTHKFPLARRSRLS
jgi:hypothetical protein